jgi:hypothetical protein
LEHYSLCGLNGADLVSARLDALKVGLSVAVGSVVVALYLSWRRRWQSHHLMWAGTAAQVV